MKKFLNFQSNRNNKYQQRYDNNNSNNNSNISSRPNNHNQISNVPSQLMPPILPTLLQSHQNLPPQNNNFSMFPNGIMNINQPLGKHFFLIIGKIKKEFFRLEFLAKKYVQLNHYAYFKKKLRKKSNYF